jgi:tetratricopeptide (TPR) repeat protein
MSAAAPLPKPDGEPGSDDDGWALLDALRRKLDDQAAQTRRTQDQVTQLAESIAALVAAGRRRSRWLNLNSFVAYLIFTVLLGAGTLFLYRNRADELVEARDLALAERDDASKRASDAAAKAAARDQAEAKAWELYQWIEQGKRGDVSGKLAALRDVPLSRTERAALAERAEHSQALEVEAALKAGAAAVKSGKTADAIASLEAALKIEPASTTRAAQMHYYLGLAYAKAGELEKAIAHLQPAVNADVEPDEARFQLASVLDRSGAYAKARSEYDRFATAHPQSPQAMFAMRRSATLARMPIAPPGPAPAPAPAPKPVAPAPAPKPVAPPPAPKPAAPSPAAPTAPPPPTTPAPGDTESRMDELPAPPVKDPDHRNRPQRPRTVEAPEPKPDPSPEPPSVPLPTPPSSPTPPRVQPDEIVGEPAPFPPRVTSR